MQIFAYAESPTSPQIVIADVIGVEWDASTSSATVETSRDTKHTVGPVDGTMPKASLIEIDAYAGSASVLVNYVFHPVEET